jgi:hypothetical protein
MKTACLPVFPIPYTTLCEITLRRPPNPLIPNIRPLKRLFKPRTAQRTNITIPMARMAARHLIAVPWRADVMGEASMSGSVLGV